MVKNATFAPTFTKKRTKMTKKFALLATVAALFVACTSGPTEEELKAKAQATEDSIKAAAAQIEADAAAAKAKADSLANAVADTVAAKVEGAVDAVKEAVH